MIDEHWRVVDRLVDDDSDGFAWPKDDALNKSGIVCFTCAVNTASFETKTSKTRRIMSTVTREIQNNKKWAD